jgi:tetratricopeptide (TPR) repeat protein
VAGGLRRSRRASLAARPSGQTQIQRHRALAHLFRIDDWPLYPKYNVPPEIRLQSSEIFELLTKLVDKSLVHLSDQSEGRYAMLQTVQDFSEINLSDEERNQVCDRHFDYYLNLAQTDRSEPGSGKDLDNFRSALSWYETVDAAGESHRLDSYIYNFWSLHGYMPDRLEAIAGRSEDGTDHVGPDFRRGAASMAFRRSEYDKAKSFALLHLEHCRQKGDRSSEASCLNFLGVICETANDSASSLRYYEDALALYLELGDRRTACKVIYNIGVNDAVKRDPEVSKSWIERALKESIAFDNQKIAQHCRIILANFAIDDGDFKKAKNHYYEALSAAEPHIWLGILGGLSRIALLQNRRETAAVLASTIEARMTSLTSLAPLSTRDSGLEKLVAEIRSGMPNDQIQSAKAEALCLTINEAIELGLNSISSNTLATH